ncbi:hypothetical protein [Clostridium saccharobutylicum]|uniref:Uncharacterized protein n=1 Tax=Clostridium saccharobutylicum DSM 13864 TaxID=1345695 RepID=U5MQP1_CLOSA|nr:hypothetical protein [Clostridium saccharobutylicum]AGX41981.1 hypothetical protein CLSA_c09700 [Clostridium saccharobutylicum DSM 13864]AQR89261.1 hypothetical protein CLOSC_09580 [Clostridium saccharobutylicum]AQR99162.1 hypothetical protein CSACC_09650 [Clostridium saccharobutylicum]AQS08894.1 hypothetical protein CLOBY_10090 [Clostridium saccharobutylicum]AQS13150.1 hypothetical protein CLOSACC_09650 [Clostridium saccharobutylicum]
MDKFELLTDVELYMIDGGKSNYDFGRELGHDIASSAEWVWEKIRLIVNEFNIINEHFHIH